MSIWFGLHLPSYSHPDTAPEHLFDRVVEQAKAAEAAGFDLVSVMDHLYQIGNIGGPDETMLEGWLKLAALARETSRVRLGTLVTGVTYRNPALLAKQVTTLDTISSGRAILGLVAAWNDVEPDSDWWVIDADQPMKYYQAMIVKLASGSGSESIMEVPLADDR